MQLLVIRHARAGDREGFAATGRDDSERPLTEDGRRRMRRVARGLRSLVPEVDVIGTSPWTRAEQTAQVFSQVYGAAEPQRVEALIPFQPPGLVAAWLGGVASDARVAVFGHEPHLGEVVSWLLSGQSTSFVRLKKGGACLLDLPAGAGAKRAELLWALPPRVLMELS